MPFADYKKRRKAAEEKIDKKLADLNANPFEDDRFWSLTVDKAGNGSAVIRYLPAKEGEDIPFVQIWEHKFKGPGGWYMELCLTTPDSNGKSSNDDPVCADNHDLWNSGIEDNKKIVSGFADTPGRKRKLTYISNIRVVKDPAKPENNGKTFLFKYGAKIFEKIQAARAPEIEDDVAINPFDMFDGANFNLSCKQKDGYRTYEASKFSKPTPVDTDKKMDEIYNNLFSLNEFIAPDKFKSATELQAKFDKVLGNSKRVAPVSDKETKAEPKGKTKKERASKVEEPNDNPPFEVSDDGDDMLATFKHLAE